jgi:Ca-activated chloride channel homolog
MTNTIRQVIVLKSVSTQSFLPKSLEHMKKALGLLFFAALFGLFLTTSCNKDEPVVKVDGIDVTIPRILLKDGKITMFISVTDRKGNAINDISKANMMIETIIDGQVTKISGFNLYSNPSVATPVAAALTMDYSGSMYWDTLSIPAMEDAVKTFISLKGLTDKLEIIKFSNGVHVVQAFTMDTLLLYSAVDSTLNLGGSTAFYASCMTALSDAAGSVSSTVGVLPAVVGFTDGVNNVAPYDPLTVITQALQLQVPLYTIGYGAFNYIDSTTLQLMADTTGGRYYYAPDPTDLQQLYQYINGQLTGSVVVGFPWGSKANATIRVTVSYQGYTAKAEKMIYY